ncbi:MAG: hypothetical protein PVH80_01085 [Anaerolineae bacterium]
MLLSTHHAVEDGESETVTDRVERLTGAPPETIESSLLKAFDVSSSLDRRLKPVLLFAIILWAAFFRLHRIDSLPPGDGYDPAHYGVDALQLLRGELLPPMLPSNREPLFSYIVAACFLLVGPSTLGIHLASALVGLATVPAVYFAAEALFTWTDLADEDRALRRTGFRADDSCLLLASQLEPPWCAGDPGAAIRCPDGRLSMARSARWG